jgi:hypothetical protein
VVQRESQIVQWAKFPSWVLELAAKESESKVDEALRTLLHQSDEPISAESVAYLLGVASSASRRDVKIAAIDLRVFDLLYTEVVQ